MLLQTSTAYSSMSHLDSDKRTHLSQTKPFKSKKYFFTLFENSSLAIIMKKIHNAFIKIHYFSMVMKYFNQVEPIISFPPADLSYSGQFNAPFRKIK